MFITGGPQQGRSTLFLERKATMACNCKKMIRIFLGKVHFRPNACTVLGN